MSADNIHAKNINILMNRILFITHRRQKADLEKARSIGIEQYNLEQQEKVQILSYLLSNYDNGYRKSFFCVAVNLLELSEIQEAEKQIQSNSELPSLPLKAQSLYVVEVFQKIADRRNIKLKLLRKSNNFQFIGELPLWQFPVLDVLTNHFTKRR